MPCYGPSWDYGLKPGTPEYESARARVEAGKKATYHVIDYYLNLCKLPLPVPDPNDAELMAAWRDLVRETARHAGQDIGTASIARYGSAVYLIAHHLRCDGVHVEKLWDQQKFIEVSDPRELAYGWIMRCCVGVMTGRFEREGWSVVLVRREGS